MTESDYDGFDKILEFAELHGTDSEADHEVGDLQDALQIAWELLNEKDRQTLVKRFFDAVAEEGRCYEDPKETIDG